VQLSTIGHYDLPCAPTSGEVICAIGDTHGRSDLLAPLIDEAERRLAGRHGRLILLGDLIDRGPDSLSCTDLAIAAATRMSVTALMGNHEQMMRLCVQYRIIDRAANARDWRFWLLNGGYAVLDQLDHEAGCRLRTMAELHQVLRQDRLAWLDDLAVFHRDGPFLFVHAGVPWADRTTDRLERFLSVDPNDSLVWLIQDAHPLWVVHPHLAPPPSEDDVEPVGRITPRPSHGVFIIHCHMPVQHDGPHDGHIGWDRLNLDGGSWSAGRTLMGVLDGASVEIVEALGQPPVIDEAHVAAIKRKRVR
jgi:hypothetical protein